MAKRWVCNRFEELVVRQWADGVSVFDEVANRYHLLPLDALQLIQTLAECGPATAEELAESYLMSEPTTEQIDFFDATLRELESLELTARVLG